MADDVIVLQIDSEAKAVSTLKRFLSGDFDGSNVTLDFSDAEWLRFHLELRGSLFHQSLNSSAMRGLIEFQNAIYRSASLIIHNSAKITSLTEEEKTKFELNFIVSSGSSDIDAEAKDGFFALASKMVNKMSGKFVFASVLVLAIGYFGDEAIKSYLDSAVDLRKVEADAEKSALEEKGREDLVQLSRDILNRDQETEKTLLDAKISSDKISKIIDERNKAFDAIMKGAEKSDGLKFKGLEIPNIVVDEINRSSRTRGRNVVIDTMFRVLSVDSSGRGAFSVKLQRVGDNAIILATLENSIRAGRYHRAIQRAEWNRKSVKVKIRARLFGEDDYRDAEIDSASTPRGAGASMPLR